jgi:hypothetical protein
MEISRFFEGAERLVEVGGVWCLEGLVPVVVNFNQSPARGTSPELILLLDPVKKQLVKGLACHK